MNDTEGTVERSIDLLRTAQNAMKVKIKMGYCDNFMNSKDQLRG
jgi:hypothetical protein